MFKHLILNSDEYSRGFIMDSSVIKLKKAIWVYFALLLFEGVLRKWVIPGLATPLLIVRDPLALWIMFTAYKHHMFPKNSYITGFFLITIFAILTTLSLGHGNIGVAIFGARIFLIQFPLMFVIGKIFDREDVIKLGKVVLTVSIPMVVLIAMQFYSPQSAWVNRGIGGDMAGSGFSGSGEYYRPSGTFSFCDGNVHFFQLVMAFVFYFLFNSENINKFVLIAASIGLLLAIPLSISRTLFFTLGIVIFFTIAAVAKRREAFGKILTGFFIAFVTIMILSQTSIFQTSIGAFTDRFESANENEGGLESVFLDRFFGGMIGALTNAFEDDFLFGRGLGMGTNVGAKLMTGKTTFLISEGEWGRLIGEMGPLLGMGIIFIRMAFSIKLALFSYIKMKEGNVLPWMILSICVLTISQGQWASPTVLGFSTLNGGLVIAALKKRIYNNDNKSE